MSLGTRWNSPTVMVGYHLADLTYFGPANMPLTNFNGVTFPVDGFGNACANFTSGTDNLYRGAAVPSSNGDWTLSLWVKFITVSASTTYGFFRWVDTSAADYVYTRIMLVRDGSSNYTLSVAPSSATLISYVIPSFATGKWYHIVITHATSDESVKLYLNGGPVASGTGGINTYPVASIYLGTDAINAEMVGRIDEVVFYNVVLNPGDIRRLYADAKGMLV